MAIKDRKEFYRQQMEKRHKESFANRNDSGRFHDFYIPTMKANAKFWKCKEDDHELYIVPYIVGSQHPTLKEGEISFFLDIFVHYKVGANEDSYICVNKTFRKNTCPICKRQNDLRNSVTPVDEKVIKGLNPSHRTLYNVVCLDSSQEEAKGIQVWEVSQFLFTQPLEELAHKKRGGGDVPYADFEKGKIISFRRKGPGQFNTEYTAFEFRDREPIPFEMMEQAYKLDDLIHIPTEEEVYEAYWSGTDSPAQDRLKEPDKEPDKEEELAEEELPRKEKGKAPDKEEAAEEKATECPYGAAFGVDYEQYEECSSCDAKKDCEDKKAEIEAQKKEPAPGKKVLTRRGR